MLFYDSLFLYCNVLENYSVRLFRPFVFNKLPFYLKSSLKNRVSIETFFKWKRRIGHWSQRTYLLVLLIGFIFFLLYIPSLIMFNLFNGNVTHQGVSPTLGLILASSKSKVLVKWLMIPGFRKQGSEKVFKSHWVKRNGNMLRLNVFINWLRMGGKGGCIFETHVFRINPVLSRGYSLLEKYYKNLFNIFFIYDWIKLKYIIERRNDFPNWLNFIFN